ncbi:hypothetical protein D9619_006473 [Psilocybe cf. subviscida]|uniref:ELMO domain-containing protein n=1 Tax=Psilocybe cf. subviscida TaxID=2480587 RepID=A0A8H5B4M0_9AGAR|nr:hypothetical protein D9619_006473 [Psilocybe cf. subviscida]
MSSAAHPSTARSPLGPSSAANGGGSSSAARPTNLVPTNNVTTAEGITVRTRIEGTLTVDDVVRQLCISLQIKDPPANFALRDEVNEELVTNENLRQKIKNKSNLKLVNAPAREAKETVEKLRSKNDKHLKLTVYSLPKYIREEAFAPKFIELGGVDELVGVIFESTGNTLAYALTAMQNIMELDYGWGTLSDAFILRVVQILSSPHSLINVCRPATAILKKLVEADPEAGENPQGMGAGGGGGGMGSNIGSGTGRYNGVGSSTGGNAYLSPNSNANTQAGGSGSGIGGSSGAGGASGSNGVNGTGSTGSTSPGSVYRYGFQVVFEQMRKESSSLETVVNRLGSADMDMAQHSMMLINSLLANANDDRWEEFIAEMERLNVRKAVVRLMSLHNIEDLTSCMDFQANVVRVTYRKKITLVDPEEDDTHAEVLQAIWNTSQLVEEADANGYPLKWRKLGFDTEDIVHEFSEVGVLGLECFKRFAESDPDFPKIVQEQLSRSEEKRCPIAKASNEVVELLTEHWAIFAPGYSTATTFQPFFLDFHRVHTLATQFFIRMWSESSATAADFLRVAALVRSQVKIALRRENTREWHEVEHDFIESEYRAVRERQMKELELEDDLLNKVPVRNLRAKLYKESFEFVREQRIQCLLQGAWFVNASPPQPSRDGTVRRLPKPWKFMRLDPAQKYLHFVESAVKFPVRHGLEDLPDRIDVSLISEIAGGLCAPPPNVIRDQHDQNPSPLSFSLLSAHEGSLADLIASDSLRWADWTDGLNMLRRDGGHGSSKETAGYVQALTEIGLKIKLLDLSGEMVEIPSGLVAGPPPANNDFFFSELL